MKEEIRLTGNFIHYGQKNLNDRVYTKECAEDIVRQFNLKKEGKAPKQEHLSGGVAPDNQWYQNDTMLGQLGYPKEGSFTSLGDVSHEIEEIHIDEENNSIVGTIKILDTPKGEMVKKLLNEEIGLSCRPRAIGNVNENGEIEDYELISFDIVTGSDAFANIAPDDFLNFLTKPDTEEKL